MAGTKGRSGGARANSGGARANAGGTRPGAGRKPKEPVIIQLSTIFDEPDKFLSAVMNDSGTDVKLRVDAAKALLSAKVRRAENGGKKEQAKDAAKKAETGKFASAAPPKLVAAGGKNL